MNQDTWSKVDEYFSAKLIPSDATLDEALRTSDLGGLPQHNVAPNQGKLLNLLAKMNRSKKIIEIGTLGGYSTIWLARSLPQDGLLVSLEASPEHAAIAKRNIENAGLSHLVDIRVGKAAETLPILEREGLGPFDFIFIDADKPNNPTYLEWSIKLSRPGTVIIGDNVVRNGAVADESSSDKNVIGVRSFFDHMADNPRITATAIQTVGSKGYDGFSMALVE